MGTSNEVIRPIPNSGWVVRGRFAAGEYPGAADTCAAASKVRRQPRSPDMPEQREYVCRWAEPYLEE